MFSINDKLSLRAGRRKWAGGLAIILCIWLGSCAPLEPIRPTGSPVAAVAVSDPRPQQGDYQPAVAQNSLEDAAPRQLKNLIVPEDYWKTGTPDTNPIPMIKRTGNARLAARTMEPAARWGRMVHVVTAGQTLAAISQQYYGATTWWQAIYNENRDQLTSPSAIKSGQKLYLPVTPQKSGKAVRVTLRHRPDFYVAAQGDTLNKIAGLLLDDAEQGKKIFDANRNQMKDQQDIQPGMSLAIPG